MDLSNVPTKSEVMSWKPRTLANYLKKLRLSGCDKVVIQENITGAYFLEMTDWDLQLFPSLHAERLTQLQTTISAQSPNPRVNHRHHHRQEAFVKQERDYEQYDPAACGNDSEDLDCSIAKINLQRPQNLYQDNLTETCSMKLKNKPSNAAKSHRLVKVPEGSVHKDLCLSTGNTPSQNYSLIKSENQPLPPQSSEMTQALDPAWYGGELTRREAEEALKEVDQDGAFVVRDSSKGRAEHPYTLMVLKEAKVYNIRIQKQGEMFFLGTGLHNNKSFPGVREIITHHAHVPLLLIDAKDQGGSSQTHRPRCRLLHPVGPRR